MKHSIALGTGATYGPGHSVGRLFANEGYREVIVTGRSVARMQETSVQLAAETKRQVFTPLELIKRGRRVDFLLLDAGMVPGKESVLTAASLEVAQATLSGNHQLPVGLLHSPSN